MPIEVRLPELAESMASATLTAWLREVGDHVTRGEPIAEVETDKTTVELEAPASGVIEAIQVSAGTADVAVGAVLALLREDASPPPGASAAAPAAPPAAGDAPRSGHPTPGPATTRPPSASAPAPGSAAAPAAASGSAPASGSVPAPGLAAPPAVETPPPAETPATPLARRMAALAGLDLGALGASAGDGRVGLADVRRALAAEAAAASRRSASLAAPGASGLPAPAAAPGQAAAAPAAAVPAGPYRDQPLSAARRVTAARMTEAKQTAPHFYLEVECAVDDLLDRLRDARAQASEADGGLTLTAVLVRAAALALGQEPLANSAWTGDALRVFETADIAVAVATPQGLVAPVVRDAGGRSLAAVAAELRDLAARARAGRLQPAEYAGGTFTLSNLGMYGVSRLYPILNPPQSGILGVGAVESRPVVRDGTVAAGRTMALTLSADHRALDGATGAAFLRALRALVERPDPLFD